MRTSVDDSAADVVEVRASGLFDADWYLACNPNVAEAGVDPLVRYVRAGAAEGRLPGSLFDVEAVAPDAPLDDQSICLMRKPERGTPPRPRMPVVETATRQPFNPDGVGKIRQSFDGSLPFLEAYGIEARSLASVGGWIVLRDDEPEGLDASVDGQALPAGPTNFEPGPPYRDWANTRQTAFETQMDIGRLAPGRHRLALRITGRRGTAHAMSIPLRVLEAG